MTTSVFVSAFYFVLYLSTFQSCKFNNMTCMAYVHIKIMKERKDIAKIKCVTFEIKTSCFPMKIVKFLNSLVH